MEKKQIESKVLKILEKLNIPVVLIDNSDVAINYIIPSNFETEENQIHISVFDTDVKVLKNDYGHRIKICDEDDEIGLYGYGFDDQSNVCTLRNFEQVIIEQCIESYKITFIDNNSEKEIIGKFSKDLNQIKDYIEKKYSCRVSRISNYFGTVDIKF